LGASLVGRVLAILLAVLGLGRFGIGIFAYRAANALERPQYEVLKQLSGGVEIRKYEPYVVAETEIFAESMRKGTGQGFTRVAGYIFGRNRQKTKMAMTAPVRTATTENSRTGVVRTKVSFVMEKAYSRGSAPRPEDGSVRLKKVAPHILAARKFSGPPPSAKRIAREEEKIVAALQAEGLRQEYGGETLVYGYHDPFITPSFMRRNEVCVPVQP